MKRKEFIQKYTNQKRYIGDGLYVNFDGFHFILSCERDGSTHWVGIEPTVFYALLNYRHEVYKEAENITDE